MVQMAELRKLRLTDSTLGRGEEQVVIVVPEWVDDAACRGLGVDGDLAFPETKADGFAFIRRFCHSCPVVQECGEYGMRLGSEHGVWGGRMFEFKGGVNHGGAA